MLEATGRDLSRQSFFKTVTSGKVFHSNVYPDVSYDGTIRFGATHRPPAGSRLHDPQLEDHRPLHRRLLGPAPVRQSLVIGIVAGSGYGLIALGLVLVYKSSGIFNFAQGEFGTVAVFALWGAHSVGVPYGLAMLLGLVAALASGLATERFVVRPLFGAPRVTLLVATAGVSLLRHRRRAVARARRQLRFVAPGPRPARPGVGVRLRRLRPAPARSSPRWWPWPWPARCSSPAPTSAWPSSASARTRWRPN